MKRILISVFIFAGWLAKLASAQPADVSNPNKAAALYEEGKRHFDIGEYTTAITSWKESYLLSNEPLLLFNIGQAYRLSGDCAQANRFYLNYKRAVPRPANQVELDKAMEKCTGVAPATGDPPTPPAAANVGNTTGPATLESQPGGSTVEPANAIKQTDRPTTHVAVVHRDDTPRRDRGRVLRITGITVAGVGGVSSVVAVLFALNARREADLVAGQPAGTRWDDALVGHERDGRDAQTRARVFTIIGAAAVVTGGALWWYGRGRSRVSVDVALGVHAREVSVSCAF